MYKLLAYDAYGNIIAVETDDAVDDTQEVYLHAANLKAHLNGLCKRVKVFYKARLRMIVE